MGQLYATIKCMHIDITKKIKYKKLKNHYIFIINKTYGKCVIFMFHTYDY